MPNIEWLQFRRAFLIQISNRKFDFSKPRGNHSAHPNPGGGEGIRTPDPRVANAVLCQLSYTPDNIANWRLPIANFNYRSAPIGIRQLEIGNEVGCGGGI